MAWLLHQAKKLLPPDKGVLLSWSMVLDGIPQNYICSMIAGGNNNHLPHAVYIF
jgi:hypothetical protein